MHRLEYGPFGLNLSAEEGVSQTDFIQPNPMQCIGCKLEFKVGVAAIREEGETNGTLVGIKTDESFGIIQIDLDNQTATGEFIGGARLAAESVE